MTVCTKRLIQYCIAAFIAAVSMTAIGSEKREVQGTNYKVFDTIEYFYNSETRCIMVYVSSPNSSLAFSGIDVKPKKGTLKTDYEIKVLSTYGGGKNDAMFKACVDGGYLVSFSAKDFHLGKDRLIYVETRGNEHEVPFIGGQKEALLKHKLLPPDWKPTPIQGIPGIDPAKSKTD